MKSFESIAESLIHSGNLSNSALNNIDNWPPALRTALDICLSTSGAMMIFWGDDNQLFYNDACLPFIHVTEAHTLMGRTAAEVIGATWNELEPAVKEVLETGKPAEISRIQFKNTPYSIHTNGMGNVSGKLVPLQSSSAESEGAALFLEPEASKDALPANCYWNGKEQEQGRSLHVLTQMLKINTVGILFFDIDGNFLDANDTFLRMVGYPRHDLESGKLNSELVSLPEWMPQTMKVFEELKTSDYFSPYEKELVRADGTRWWGLFAGTRLADNEFVEFVLDITEKKNIELALGKAKDSAEKALKAKDEFLSVMSHELRTPLSAIIGLINLLLKNDPRNDQMENLTALRISSRNMLNLINEILDFSKIEAGKMKVNPVGFGLKNFLAEIREIHQVNAVGKGLDLKIITSDNLPDQIVADRVKLSRVLDNLLTNAIKFTGHGQVTLEVKYAGKNGNTLMLDFSVSDTGIGIPQEKIGQIFEKFMQADSSTTRRFGGTGLGLAIVRNMLKLLNSEIFVESYEGKGSRFFFKLPVQEGDLKSGVTQSPPSETLNHPIDAKILIAEDADINRMIICQFLSDWCEKEPDEATNGKEAVEMALTNNYDIILMDVRMPEMNGYEATRMIKSVEHLREIPVIALTANTFNDIKKNPDSELFDDVIIKPFEPEDLRRVIYENLLAGRNSGEEAASAVLKGQKIDFSMIEEQFQGNEEKLKVFYQSTLDHLIGYKKQFRRSVVENDIEEYRNMQHNITMLINLFKLDDLKDFLQFIRNRMNGSQEEIQEEVVCDGERLFDAAILNIQKKL